MIEEMTKRQRFLAAMRRAPTDGELVWAPNFDYWLSVNRARGTLPDAYQNKSRNDIVRAIGGSIWCRAYAINWQNDPAIRHIYDIRPNGVHYHEIITPIGNICEEFAPTEFEHSTYAHTKHFITDRESLRVMTYVVEATQMTVNFDETYIAIEETGEDGIILHQEFCVPLIQFAKTDAGYMNAFYLMEDYPDDVDNLISIYHQKYIKALKLICDTPADVFELSDNMDEVMISPKLFERYATPFYQECKEVLKDTGIILEAHWCGHTQHLLPMLPKTGIDVVEAVVTEPMADITLEAALDILDGKVTLQGGIPSVLVCPDIVSQRDFDNYIESVVLSQKGRTGFILGMSDNVPPDADFSRIEKIAGLI